MARRLAPLLVAAVLPVTALAQSADRALLTELAKVKAVDAHSHLLINRVEPAGKALATQRSATDLPLRLRGVGPEWVRTWKVLYKLNLPDTSEKRMAELQQTRELMVEDLGAEFSTRMLDQANVEMAIVSGEPLTGKGMARFRFVPRADVFLRPFAQDSAEALKPFFVAARMYTLPRGLDEYLSKVVTGALERWVSEGAVGIDVGVAAWRSLDFDEVNAEAARSAYGRLVVGGEFGARACRPQGVPGLHLPSPRPGSGPGGAGGAREDRHVAGRHRDRRQRQSQSSSGRPSPIRRSPRPGGSWCTAASPSTRRPARCSCGPTSTPT